MPRKTFPEMSTWGQLLLHVVDVTNLAFSFYKEFSVAGAGVYFMASEATMQLSGYPIRGIRGVGNRAAIQKMV